MKNYLALVRDVLENGEERDDRTGTGVISVFGTQSRYDLREGFPLLTTKKVLFSSVVHELLWFLSGSTNVSTLETKIWNNWADKNGNLGCIYGHQWRSWKGYKNNQSIDQISKVIETIKNKPFSRRHIVSAWNVADLENMALEPCHCLFQFYVSQGHLDCQLYQRSADIALGVPFNIAGYSLLLMMIAQECDLTPRFFIHSIGDAHIYLNHREGLKEQIKRPLKALPQVKIKKKPLFEINFDDISLEKYEHAPFIKYPISV